MPAPLMMAPESMTRWTSFFSAKEGAPVAPGAVFFLDLRWPCLRVDGTVALGGAFVGVVPPALSAAPPPTSALGERSALSAVLGIGCMDVSGDGSGGGGGVSITSTMIRVPLREAASLPGDICSFRNVQNRHPRNTKYQLQLSTYFSTFRFRSADRSRTAAAGTTDRLKAVTRRQAPNQT